MVRPPVRSIIHSLKLMDYLSVQADKPFSIYHITVKFLAGCTDAQLIRISAVFINRVEIFPLFDPL